MNNTEISQVVNYRTDSGVYTAIAGKKGRKLMTVIMTENTGVVARRIPLTEQRYMKPATFKGRPYPLNRAIRKFSQTGKRLGITKSAKKALKEVA